MAHDRADSPRAMGGVPEVKLEIRAPKQERPKLSVEARLEALSNELTGINALLDGSREMVAQMKADIVETRKGGEDPRDEEQQLIAYLEELEQARTKQKELQKELADLSRPERTELDVMGHALDRAYAAGDEAKIQELEKAMLDEYEKGPIEMSKELREERAERAMTPEQKTLRTFQDVVGKVEASRVVLHTKPEESRAAAEELQKAKSEVEWLLRREAEGQNVDKEALKKLQARLPELETRAAALSAEVAKAHKDLFEDEQRAIDLVMKDPQARYTLAETAKAQAQQQFDALRKNPAEAKKWLEETYIPEQLEKQHVLPTLKDLEIEFKRRKALQDEAGNKEYSEELFVRELKSEMSGDGDRSFFKYRNREYGKPFLPQRGGAMLAADVAMGVGRDSAEQGRTAFFAERNKYLDEVIRLFGSSSATHGHRYFSGYDLPKYTADKLATAKVALSEAAKKALFAGWEGGGDFPKQYVFDRIATEETRAAGERVIAQAYQFETIAKQEAELAAQTPKVPDFAERAAAFERSRRLDEERQALMRAAERAAQEEAAEPLYRRSRSITASLESGRSLLGQESSKLYTEKSALEAKLSRGELMMADASPWERDRAAQALAKEQADHARYRDELIEANVDPRERQALEARGLKLDYTRLAIANKDYAQSFAAVLTTLDGEIAKLGTKPKLAFQSTKDKWDADYLGLTRQRTVLQNLKKKFDEEYQAAMKENIDRGERLVADKRQALSQAEARYASSQREIEGKREAQRQDLAGARERLTVIGREMADLEARRRALEQESTRETSKIAAERQAVADEAKKAYLHQFDPKGELQAHVSINAQTWGEELGAQVESMLTALRKESSIKDSLADTSETVVFSERLKRAKEHMVDARAKAARVRGGVAALVDSQRSNYGSYNRSTGELLAQELRSRSDERAIAAVRGLAQAESR